MSEGPDPAFVRYSRMSPSRREHALRLPAARRLLVSRVAHYVDHEHLRPFTQTVPYARLFLNLDGSGVIRLGDRAHSLTPGSALLIPALTLHSGQANRTGWDLWYCDFAGTDVDDIFTAAGVSIERPLLRPADPQGLAAMMGRIIDCYEIGYSPARLLEAVGVAWTLVMGLCADRVLTADKGSLDRAVDHLQRHTGEEVRVADVAALVGLSPVQLERLFHRSFGKGVLAYQIDLRMERARRLLAETDQRVARVARETGYADPDYFSRHFRKMNGVSPLAYRRQHSPLTARANAIP